jgi:2-polyprenyl-6-methoxyphenol hydroxylase-like FAD-dependent oxidoreductase
MTPRIAIIGAGPGGLTLASLLSKKSISYTVFDIRSQPLLSSIDVPSGALDLHAESGILALEACGLLAAFRSLSSECSEDMILADK